MGYYDEVRAVPKPTKKVKEPKPLVSKTPLQAKTPLVAKTPLKAKPIDKKAKAKVKKKSNRVPKGEIKIPSRKIRGTYGDEEYQKALEVHGQKCKEPNCSASGEEMHHPKFKSGGGRGKWRNAIPLCKTHHILAHTERAYADKWRDFCLTVFGEHYYKDEYDLWQEQKISDPNKEEYETFMLREEKECQESG